MRIRIERKKAGLTQMDLARFAGVNQGTISRLEKGRLPNPSFETLSKIAWALKKCGRNVDAADLQPKRQPLLAKGARTDRKRRRIA
jgi:transcriptional regulator with XRE-family HTH domain